MRGRSTKRHTEPDQSRAGRRRRISTACSADSAEWTSPVVFVPKTDETLRFCVNCRKLDAATVRDSDPLPRMDEYINSLVDATVVTRLDCNSGCYQMEFADEDRDKTTVASHCGIYRFLRMPFGLKNAPATFQRAVDIILSRVKWETALTYPDDVIVYLRSVTEHMAHVREVLRLLHSAGVSLKLSKCAFLDTSVTYLGHAIHLGRLDMERRNVIAFEHARLRTKRSCDPFSGCAICTGGLLKDSPRSPSRSTRRPV